MENDNGIYCDNCEAPVNDHDGYVYIDGHEVLNEDGEKIFLCDEFLPTQ